jgi:hypothetical protein
MCSEVNRGAIGKTVPKCGSHLTPGASVGDLCPRCLPQFNLEAAEAVGTPRQPIFGRRPGVTPGDTIGLQAGSVVCERVCSAGFGQQSLVSAAELGRVQKVRRFLAAGANAESRKGTVGRPEEFEKEIRFLFQVLA